MDVDAQSLPCRAWLYLASAIAVGIPAAFVAAVLLGRAIEADGIDPTGLSTTGTFVFWAVTLSFGFLLANEVAAVQLGDIRRLSGVLPSKLLPGVPPS